VPKNIKIRSHVSNLYQAKGGTVLRQCKYGHRGNCLRSPYWRDTIRYVV